MPTQEQKDAVIEAQAANQDLLVKAIELLPEQVIKNVEVISNHQDQQQQNATAHQRGLDKIAAVFGQPQFLYFQIVLFTVWGAYSHFAEQNILPQNFPLFDFSEKWLEVSGLLISTGVLIYQTRQEELSEERSQLALQINLLTEQKIAKLISLVEELRIDLPNVKNRDDLEAEAMKQATDPQAILGILQKGSEHGLISPLED
jgi:uncharacterized membrane protein